MISSATTIFPLAGGGDKDSFVDQQLKQQGLSRHRRVFVPFFTSALNTLCRTDMLLVIPVHIAVNMQQFFPITFLSLPMTSPEHKYWLLWHPKYNNDPMHQWLREHVLELMHHSMHAMEAYKARTKRSGITKLTNKPSFLRRQESITRLDPRLRGDDEGKF